MTATKELVLKKDDIVLLTINYGDRTILAYGHPVEVGTKHLVALVGGKGEWTVDKRDLVQRVAEEANDIDDMSMKLYNKICKRGRFFELCFVPRTYA